MYQVIKRVFSCGVIYMLTYLYLPLIFADVILTGKVSRTDGLTLPGVKVELFTNNVKFSSTTTDNNGTYSLTIATETFWVFVSSPGFYANLSTGVVVNSGQTKSLDVSLSSAPPGLVAYLKFDEMSGNLAFDYSGNGNHGILTNGPKWVGGMYGGALKFDGMDDSVEIPGSNTIPYSNSERTVSARFYTYPDTWRNDQHAIITYGQIADAQAFGLDMGEHPYVQVFVWGRNGDINEIDTGASEEGWLFLTGTYDGSTLASYVNGFPGKTSNPTNGINTIATEVRVGREGIKGERNYLGLIDEIRIYNRALRLSEIRADMGTVTGKIKGKVTKADGITPIPDAFIQFLSGSLVVSSVTANSYGEYSTSLTAGTYNIQTIAKGYQVYTSSSIYIPPDGVTETNLKLYELVEGLIFTIAGIGTAGFSGDERLAITSELNGPRGLCVDAQGNLYIAEIDGYRIRKIDTGGIIHTIAGTGKAGFAGESAAAKNAQLNYPTGVDTDSSGNVYIADYQNHLIRSINTSGTIRTVAGTPLSPPGFGGDSGMAANSFLNAPQGVGVDKEGNIYIADMSNNRIRKVNSVSGVIYTVVGMGTAGFAGDGGLAADAKLNAPAGVFVDTLGSIFIADSTNHRVRKVDTTTGIITTVAGSGVSGFSGDGGLAVTAKLNTPKNVYVDVLGNLYISDYVNNCIRKVDTAGIITTVAGTGGSAGFSGDGGLAVNAQLDGPGQIFMDSIGNLYIADQRNNRVRKVFLGLPVGTLTGKVTKSDGITAMSNVLVEVLSGTVVIKSTSTDSTGNYTLSLSTGIYTVQVSYTGYQTQTKNEVLVKRVDTTVLNFNLEAISNIPKPKSEGEIKIYGGNSTSSRGAVNPTKGEKAVIGFKGNAAGTFYLRIFNITGDLIYQENKPFLSAEGFFEWIPRDSLSPDIYIVSIDGPGIKMKKKIAIVK